MVWVPGTDYPSAQQHIGYPVSVLADGTDTGATPLRDNDAVIGCTLARLSDAGILLAIDDFGTGYSSLSYLQQLPAQTVKLDRSFMQGLETEPRKRALVSTTTMLCQELGYRVVAEGLETAENVAAVSHIGCDQGQGYYFARPMAAEALTVWLAQARSEGTHSL